MDLLQCNWDSAKYLIFSENIYDPLIYYSHLLPLISALILGFFVFLNNRKAPINKLFFLLTLAFSVWVYFDLILWASEKAELVMFFWSNLIFVEFAIFAIGFWLAYAFLHKEKVPSIYKAIFIGMFMPIIALAATSHNLIAYDLSNCDRGVFEGALWTYLYIVEFVVCLLTAFVAIRAIVNQKNHQSKRQNIIFSIGILTFMLIFFAGNLTLVSDMGWNYEQYKLFGMLFFLMALLFIIVKFKTFSAKIIGAQALVWVIIIIIAAQFLFIESEINKILNAITLSFAMLGGYYLVQSVKQIDVQKSMLEQANQNQQSLLHFITHQVKGYMTKTRNIFDGLLAGDYGSVGDQKMREIIKYGFDSETKGVETVQAILRASDLKTGRTEFNKEVTNLSRLVAEISEKAKEAALKKGLDFTFDIEPNITANVDPLRLGEVFKNLMDNAVTYTAKGALHVTLHDEGDSVKFTVMDTGFGLTHDDKERLFTEGGKGKDSLSINIDSTGYGLFIAKKIVEQHNGNIGAHSEGRGKGSEFFVILPKMQ